MFLGPFIFILGLGLKLKFFLVFCFFCFVNVLEIYCGNPHLCEPDRQIRGRARLFGGFYGLVTEALQKTTNLIGLDIADMDPLLAHLVKIPFPHLLEVKLPYSPQVTQFLHHHRNTLKAIVVQGSARAEQMIYPKTFFKNVDMPELLAFVGPCTVVPFVLPKSQVGYLTVCWEPGHERPEEIVKSVAESRKDVVGMDNLVVGWSPGLLSMIGTHLPKMERLRIRCVCPNGRELMEVCVSHGWPPFSFFFYLFILFLTLTYYRSTGILAFLGRRRN